MPSESTPLPAQSRGLRQAAEGLSTNLGLGLPVPSHYLDWLRTLFPGTYTRPLAHFHEEFWERIWDMRPERSATEFYIWPRGFSKTTNAERAVIALAARGFKYILYVKETQDQANDAVQNIAAVLESPEVERHYPLLSQRQVNKFGHSKGWKRDRIRTASGTIVDAAGLDVSIRGLLLEGSRPDVIILDDIDGKEDTLRTTEKKIRRITSDIVPAGAPNRVILGLQNIINPHGVFTRLADLCPDHPADFLLDRFVSGPYPAVYDLEYEQSGVNEHGKPVYRITAGESSWPEARPLDMLEAELNQMGPTQFIEEKQNEVGRLQGNLYKGFKLKAIPRPPLSAFLDTVVVCDPAVTNTNDSDSNGVRSGGLLPNGQIVGLYSWEGRDSVPNNLKRAFRQALAVQASTIILETNQGGDTWITTYRAVWRALVEDPDEPQFTRTTRMPRMVQVKASNGTGGKRERWQIALGGRERGEFVEAEGTHEVLFGALKRLPEHTPYDLSDADAWLYLYLSGRYQPDHDDDEDGSVVTSNVA
ncbi:hypothetical protein [Deinococcus radiotolerans]|uniref:Terminase large subunit gp17-like C-terminal domain-containing protein n=1 Tax=Deinococcus radiotolerans TaxID=1309407 RepID=A0ABQ2FQ62_9DEIO|nr:hypothetical protein [Deinococcus radiotolerans]GGL15743.1 hypothetical protein GCM10010844_38350 [Deinococcus radiotolerans]